MLDALKDKFGIEDSVLYVQNLNGMLSRIHLNSENDAGSLVMVKLSKSSNYKYNLEDALNKIKEYDFDNMGNIKDIEGNCLIFVANKLRDTKDCLEKTVKEIEKDLSKYYDKEKFKVSGMMYDGKERLSAEQAIERLNSMSGQF